MAAFTFGFITMNGKKIAGVEEINLEASREQDEVFECDQTEVDEIIPTRLKYQLTFKKAYTGPEFFKAMKNGTKLGAILFKRDPETKRATSLRDVRGIVINKDTLGPVTGNKHVVEEITAGASTVIELD